MIRKFLNIVIADDEPNWREKYKEWLKSSDCFIHEMIANIYPANDAFEALEIIRKSDIHLCVADLFMMPGCLYPDHIENREKPFGGVLIVNTFDPLCANKIDPPNWPSLVCL